jgi:purine-binding chemotaxis protein CheW
MEQIERYLSFIIDDRRFAFEAKDVLEVLIDKQISQIPKAADYIVGVVNFRGEVVTVVDTSVKFGVKDYEIKVKRIIIIICMNVDDKQIKLGCLCDSVIRMESIDYTNIQQVPNFGTYYNPELLKGVFYVEKDLYSIIDIEKIFTTDEVLVLTSISENNKADK